MGQSVTLTGMVLTAMPIGEYDKRITILTKERGKITVFARGARRPNSQLLAGTNPFSFGNFELFEGKSAYNLSRASIQNYFRSLTMDLDATYLGFYFLEFAEYFCQENSDEKEMLKLLYQSLRALESPALDNRLVKLIFELRGLTINGEGPSMFTCLHCRKKEELEFFSVKRGGMFCLSCGKLVSARRIQESTRYTMQYIVSVDIAKLYSFAVSNDVLDELESIMKEYRKEYIHHEFKALKTMEEGVFFTKG